MLSSWQKHCIKGDNSKPPASDPNEQPNYTVNEEKLQNAILLQWWCNETDICWCSHNYTSHVIQGANLFPPNKFSGLSVFWKCIYKFHTSGDFYKIIWGMEGWIPKNIPCSPMNQGYNNLYTAVKCCLIPWSHCHDPRQIMGFAWSQEQYCYTVHSRCNVTGLSGSKGPRKPTHIFVRFYFARTTQSWGRWGGGGLIEV